MPGCCRVSCLPPLLTAKMGHPQLRYCGPRVGAAAGIGWNNPAELDVEAIAYPRGKGFPREKDLCSAASDSFYSSACCTPGSCPCSGCACTRPAVSNDPVVGCQTFRCLQPLRSGEIRIAVGRRFGVLSRQERLEQRTASSG